VPAGLRVLPYAADHPTRGVRNLRVAGGRFVGDWQLGATQLPDLPLRTPGRHNLENALAAATVAQAVGLTAAEIREGLASFRGVRRRFEYIVDRDDLAFISDYAHHPTELTATLAAARALYPGRRLTVLFQPHLYSRTRDFMADFAEVLSRADELLLLPIYAAREAPIAGVTSATLLDGVDAPVKQLLDPEEVVDYLSAHPPQVLLLLGAGDVDGLIAPLRRALDASP
ncbi:MAG: cyanophycin synthetase, partial [Catalinimonas sp.]